MNADTDKFHVHERIAALHEMHGRDVSGRSLALYWDALATLSRDDFDLAYARAVREMTKPATPKELRELAREARRGRAQEQHAAQALLCHFHGDGKYEPMERGRPDEPSTNRTVWWCARCAHFVGLGLQQEDRERKTK